MDKNIDFKLSVENIPEEKRQAVRNALKKALDASITDLKLASSNVVALHSSVTHSSITDNLA
jgi:ribosomal protein L9